MSLESLLRLAKVPKDALAKIGAPLSAILDTKVLSSPSPASSPANAVYTNDSTLFIPYRGRGLFGGTLAAQAVLAALMFTNSNKSQWKPVSLHCNFLSAAQPSPSLFYHVYKLRDGKNNCIRAIDMYQSSQLVFRAICLLQNRHLTGSAAHTGGQLLHNSRAPVIGKDIAAPEDMLSQEQAFSEWAATAHQHPHLGYLKTALEDVTKSYAREPCLWRLPRDMFDLDAVSDEEINKLPSERILRYWVKPKEALVDPHLFAYAAVAYISDYFYLSTNPRLNMREMFTTKFSVSLDHTIYFTADAESLGQVLTDYISYSVRSLRCGENRALMAGTMYGKDGKLIAETLQEGMSVMHADA